MFDPKQLAMSAGLIMIYTEYEVYFTVIDKIYCNGMFMWSCDAAGSSEERLGQNTLGADARPASPRLTSVHCR